MNIYKCDHGKKSNGIKCINPCFFAALTGVPKKCMMDNQAGRAHDWKKCTTHELIERKTKAPNRAKGRKKGK